MIKSFSTLICKHLKKNNSSLTKTDLLKMQYTLEVILGDISKLSLIFIIFLFFNEIPLFFLIFVILISTRTLGGGIHCKTYTSCLIVSTIYFLSILLFSKSAIQLNINFYIVFFIISFIITLTYAPCKNEKRPIKNKTTLKILSLISLTFWSILFFKLSDSKIYNCIFLSILIQIIQLIIVNIKGVVRNAKIYKYFFSHTT
ncbi:putative AgrB-like protein [Clostridium saccharobutylicum]|uniref:Putative AgrB-like protein Cfg n=3 Tax=Clostridium saccharobutylicum TaxID=169679 RepID=U5MM44_CLOSA|nr:accessory gene regulator B family protein [Clostridium saccharobutylicum]AGX41593.1 putative AgrB-like protein Cfg [Clostridium saccharobutylicum DSM 13864]AQR88874.1 putative AgrB-like protein [Clostridium saccharobutylicum]AQR98773.1 putative AgrB-like protein [Clostridium saccharobutylicum]AQS08498.1 putative AgrB-like protein [Clostridium saccharobutylicum]AQS12763.1 putative AgrB-like protein [Clostridium saccharobutylicum]